MSTSQRSEGMNALSKILLDSHTSIYKFVQQFEKIVASRYEKEDEQDFKTASGEAFLWSYDPIERSQEAVEVCYWISPCRVAKECIIQDQQQLHES